MIHMQASQCLSTLLLPFFFFNDTATTEIYTLSLHDALPICRWQGNARPKLQPQECRHPIAFWQPAGRVDLAPVSEGFCRLQEVICRFVYRQAEDTLRVGADVGERNGATTGVAVQMEAVPTGILGGLADAVELHRDVVPLRRGSRSRAKLEVLGNKPGAVFQLSEEAGGGEVVGDCTAGALDLR